MKTVDAIAREKARKSLKLWDLQREKWIFSRIRDMSEKMEIPWDYMQAIYNIMFSLSISHQANNIGNEHSLPSFSNAIDLTLPFRITLPNKAKLKIAFQGQFGAFSHLAIETIFPNAIPIPSKEFTDVKEKLAGEFADLAVLPFFNTIAGTVNLGQKVADSLEHVVLYKFPVKIQHMLAVPDHINSIDQIEFVHSHPEALRQCHNFLKTNGFKGIEQHDTAGAAKMISKTKKENVAALCSEAAAKIYGLKILKRNVQDIENNFTFFAIVANTSKLPKIYEKLSNT